MDDRDILTGALERLTGDPMAGAVPGTVTVLSASEPTGRARYQECTVELSAEAPGIGPAVVRTGVVTTRRHWPTVGAVLPARVSVSTPTVVDVDWDALAR